MPETAPNNEARSSDEPHNQENSGSPHEDKKSSAKKVEANRRNAQKSTGPKTAQGKARVRSNAIKHGWLADQVLLFTYSEEHRLFAALMKELWQHFEPVGTSEAILVQQIAIGLWRERQGLRWEIAQKAAASWFVPVSASEEDSDLQEREREPTPREILLGEKMPDIDRLDLIIRYQAANDRRLYRAFTHLERLRRSRKASTFQRRSASLLMVLRGKGTGNYETKPRSVFFSSLPESSHAKGWPQHRIIAGCGLRRVGSLMFGLALTLGRDLGLLSHEFGKSVDRLLTGEEKN